MPNGRAPIRTTSTRAKTAIHVAPFVMRTPGQTGSLDMNLKYRFRLRFWEIWADVTTPSNQRGLRAIQRNDASTVKPPGGVAAGTASGVGVTTTPSTSSATT